MRRCQAEPPVGPLLSRFSLGGLEEGKVAASPWGNLSFDFHQLLRTFAETRCANMGRAAGWEGEAEGMLGKVISEVRRAFSGVVLRSQAVCILEGLAQLGPDARTAAQLRQVTLRLGKERPGKDGKGLHRIISKVSY